MKTDYCPKCSNKEMVKISNTNYMCNKCFHEEKETLEPFQYYNYKNTTNKLTKRKGRKNKTMENEHKEYVNHKPQDKDVFICMSEVPYKSEPKEVLCFKGTEKEELKTITNYGIYVKRDMESETFFLNITKAMYNNLDQIKDLKDKKIVFYTYEHRQYGTLLSVKELK